jgi:hypothetical protein
MSPSNLNPVQWNQALGLARQSCARIFRDGGRPADALAAFGLRAADAENLDWRRAVDIIAQSLCTASSLRKAA